MSYIPHQETDEATGITLKIVADDHGDTESPCEYDTAIIFAVLHRHYANPAANHGLTTPEAIADFGARNRDWAQFALYLYDHSGTTYRIGAEITKKSDTSHNPFTGRLPQGHAEFDSGRVGSIFIKRSEVGRGKARKAAEQFCETYTDWANGNIYGYAIEDEDGDELDSCWGFIGDYDGYVLEEGRREYERHVESALTAQAEATRAGIIAGAEVLEASRPDLYA